MEYSFAIIDSDAISNLQLQFMLQDYGDFSFSGLAKSAREGMNHILKFLPDLVLVNLNEEADAHLRMVADLHQYVNKLPTFIAFSKTKKYAYGAIKNDFFDYWLLPHDEFEIRKTIFRFRKKQPENPMPPKLCLKSYRDYQYIDTNEILYLKADNNATDFFMKDGRTISAYKTLKIFEEQLPKNFVRIHQSYILNTEFVSGINYGKATCSLKIAKNQLPFSKTYLDRVDVLKKTLSKNSIGAVK